MKVIKFISIFTLSLSIAVFAGNVVAKHESEESVEERIKPEFKVHREGDEVAQVANELPKPEQPAGARTGEDIYTASCSVCHNSGVAGAPKLGDAAAWSGRVAKGIDAVYASAIDGLNAMPAKGTCSDCSDDELKATVDYMVENSK